MVRRPRVYIAGPISKGDLLHNIKQADDAFYRLVKAGFAPFNPMWSVYAGGVCEDTFAGPYAYAFAFSSLNLTHEEWLGVDLEWVAVSDVVLRLPGESVGADRETAHALSLGIPVYNDIECLITDKDMYS